MSAVLAGGLLLAGAAFAPAYAVPCNFDDDADPLCQTALDGTWIYLGGVASRYTPLSYSPPYSLYNNFSSAIGIVFNNVMDFDSAYIANVSAGSLNILGFLNNVEVANSTINFMGVGNTYVLYNFDSSFDRIDTLRFNPFTPGFSGTFGTFSMDDPSVSLAAASGIPEPGTLALCLGLLGLGFARRNRDV